MSHPRKSAVIAVLLLHAIGVLGAPLPQKHPYQKALRNYLATLKAEDFEVELKAVEYVEEAFAEPDALARYWMLFLSRKADIPSRVGMQLAAKHFTLAAVEAGENVNMNAGRGGFMDPKDVAWWVEWEYPGNPYRNSKPLKLRAFAAAAIDMMMQDQDHENGRNQRSDYLGGSMIRFGYTYRVVKDAVPEAAQKAYEAGLIRMFEKLERYTPRGSGGSDMEFFQLVGMWHAAKALGDPYPDRALARAHIVIDRITSKTGYEKHGGAFDVSYQGIALRFLTWAAMLYNDPKVNAALHKMLVLKSHLTLPEPDGKLFGPTHFSTGTAADAPHDQWAWVSRDAAMSMIDDEALYTVWARIGLLEPAAMASKVRKGIERLSAGAPSEKAPKPWHEIHWVSTVNYAHDLYRPGFYARLLELDQQKSVLAKPPFARPGDFITDLNGGSEFLAVKFGGYGAIIHTGAIARKWARGVSGKSGGSLSAFWTPELGSVVLGRCRATQSKTPDEWTDANARGPYTWGVHAITGRGAKGKYFSSARIRHIESKYEIEATRSAVVTISGNLGGSKWADPDNDLTGAVKYSREFRLDQSGVGITSSLTAAGQDKMQELWEMIPVFFGNVPAKSKTPVTEVAFRVDGEWQPAPENAVKADQVRVSRYGKHAYIVLDRARLVKMSPDLGRRTHGGIAVRNVMIDLLDGGAKPSVRYKIAAEL